jgi:hypothetical protein
MGIFPQPFLSRLQPAVELTLKRMVTVPAPPVDATASGEQPNDGR